MSELLRLDHLSLNAGGPTLSMSVREGQWVAVMGPAGSGKSHLLEVLSGRQRPAEGTVTRMAETSTAGNPELSPRFKPSSLARGRHDNSAAETNRTILALGLQEVAARPLMTMTPAQAAATRLLPAVASKTQLLFVDGLMDALDPWALAGALNELRTRRQSGSALVVATHRADIAQAMDAIIVLGNGSVKFAGSIEELLRTAATHTLTVVAERQAGARALVEPFSVSVRQEGENLLISAKEGQELAAKLLLEGYGNVSMLIQRPPTLQEALTALLG